MQHVIRGRKKSFTTAAVCSILPGTERGDGGGYREYIRNTGPGILPFQMLDETLSSLADNG
jgi:hypothetical protein